MSSYTTQEVMGIIERSESNPGVMRRVKALKKLQFEKLTIDGQLALEVIPLHRELHPKFQKAYRLLNEKRRDITTGDYEPKDNELSVDSSEEGNSKSVPKTPEKGVNLLDLMVGIPGFWLKAMQSIKDIEDWIESRDLVLLFHVKNIEVTAKSSTTVVLTFSFEPNDYFDNPVLTKEYEIKFGPNPRSPWDLDECYVVQRKGCSIDWKDGKNITQTLRQIRKSKKTKSLGTDGKEVVKIASFFNFFSPPEDPKSDSDKVDKRLAESLERDWCLGKALFKKLVPNAVLYYTRDVCDVESESSEESNDSRSGSEEPDSESQ